MRIECPSCQSAYEVPDAQVNGRRVRCARCGAQWTPPEAASVEPAVSVPLLAAIPAVEPRPAFLGPPRLPLEPRNRPSASRAAPARWVLATAWLGSLLLIAVVLAAAVLQRDAVMRVWPPSARLYGAAGLR